MAYDLSNFVNWPDLEHSLGSALVDGLHQLADAEDADLREYASGIAKNMVAAVKLTDHKLEDELIDQAKALAYASRMNFERVGWATAEGVLRMIFRALLGAVKALIIP